MMKYYQCPVTQSVTYEGCNTKPGSPLPCFSSRKSVKPVRNVHFPNDVVFQDYVRQGELERIGRFIRTRRVTLDTMYPSGKTSCSPHRVQGSQ